MAALAEETGSAFLRGYVAVQVDAVNLRTAVRTLRMGKGADFLLGALLEGGDLAPDAVAKAASSGAAGLRELYGATRFRDAAEAGAEALKGAPLAPDTAPPLHWDETPPLPVPQPLDEAAVTP